MRLVFSQRDIHLRLLVLSRLSLLLLAVTCLSACSGKGIAAKPQAVRGKDAVPVKVATVAQKTIPLEIHAIGNVEAISVVSVKAQIGGQLNHVYFQPGQLVKKGDLLFKIDSRPLEASLTQAKATLAKDLAQVQQAEAKRSADLAQVQQANAKWQADLTQIKQSEAKRDADAAQIKAAISNLSKNTAEARQAEAEARRYASLLKEGAISKNQYEQYRTQAESSSATSQAGKAAIENAQASARASSSAVENARAVAAASNAAVENARATVKADEAVIESAQATVKADEAAIENAQIQLSYSSIYAPIDGRTGSLLVTEGNLIKANDTTAMVTINQVSPIYVTFTIPQQKLSQIRQYMANGQLTVKAIIGKDVQHPVIGKLTFIDNAVDNTTGTIKLKATFDNLDNRLWPGQFVNVLLELTQETNAIAVPSQAIQTGQKGQFVFVVKPDMSVQMQPITVSRTVDGDAVIAEGLQPGEKVVTDGTLRLVPGAKVRIGQGRKPGKETEEKPADSQK
ncbi:efflux RND transporter periplasmic adaptor subunit [Phormidium sp. LEGE 05292]|uniref:efflux RND transporter periplasmic adaptor subunit n=1 Tax=[Phormidium] sp. LEGE 05292 TaxID=767427 RepID=UPI0018827360|nr:efflux RND transporter periplasmic adaptor subunit [Phormidium sp. LEGE 05292]MBE9229261.1 efflux RND transporter periplasmic adaptor subunit [Phormidium sp. LEGE 05292]